MPWERSLKPLDSVQRALVTKKSVIKPDQRYAQIMNVVNSRQFETDPYLKELNIQVDSKEMLEIKARILPPPEVKYRGQGNTEITERVNFGKWSIRNRFFTTRDIAKWGMIYFGTKPNGNVIETLKEFENRLPQVRKNTRSLSLDGNNSSFPLVITTLWYNNQNETNHCC